MRSLAEALGTVKDHRQQQGHYLIVLKDNQLDLAQTVQDWFEPFPPSR